MSALGQKRTCAVQLGMSALPPIADMCGAKRDVRFVPKADIYRSIDHLIGEWADRNNVYRFMSGVFVLIRRWPICANSVSR